MNQLMIQISTNDIWQWKGRLSPYNLSLLCKFAAMLSDLEEDKSNE